MYRSVSGSLSSSLCWLLPWWLILQSQAWPTLIHGDSSCPRPCLLLWIYFIGTGFSLHSGWLVWAIVHKIATVYYLSFYQNWLPIPALELISVYILSVVSGSFCVFEYVWVCTHAVTQTHFSTRTPTCICVYLHTHIHGHVYTQYIYIFSYMKSYYVYILEIFFHISAYEAILLFWGKRNSIVWMYNTSCDHSLFHW